MVFMSYLIALSLICFCLGLLLIMFAKSKLQLTMSFLFLFLSGILLVSGSILTSDSVIFLLLGLVTATIIMIFHFRDHLFSEATVKIVREDEIE